MNWVLIGLLGALAVANSFLVYRLNGAHEMLKGSLAREHTLVALLNKTTDSLKMQNSTVADLLAEKRTAWGLPAEAK